MNIDYPHLLDELDRLLNCDENKIRHWERHLFDELTGSRSTQLVLCGAGGLGRRTLLGLRTAGIEPLAITDNNPDVWNKTIEGLQILPPDDVIKQFGGEAAFIVTVWGALAADRMGDRVRQWTNSGCSTVLSFLPLFWKYSEIFLPFWACDLPHRVIANAERIRKVGSLWTDESSLAEFYAQIKFRISGEFDVLPPTVNGLMYFGLPFIELLQDEHFVDCGAYTGDTLADFLSVTQGSFKKYTALEPDPQNIARLREFIETCAPEERGRIEVLSCAAHSRRESLRFAASGTASSSLCADGSVEVQGERLDAIFANESPTFIKMDIEGAEIEAIRGAASLLQRTRPVLAISSYHVQEHVWEIPELLASLLCDYNFHLAPHHGDCWDLVCYAVPRERAVKKLGKHY
jgi:FkbM family methyltransferase